MADEYYDALTNALRSGRDAAAAIPDVTATLLRGMGASSLAGLRGLGAGAADVIRGHGRQRRALEDAAGAVEDTEQNLAREPSTDVGRRGLENIGNWMEAVNKPLRENIADPVGENFPLAGAALVTLPQMIGPKGTKGATRAAEMLAAPVKRTRAGALANLDLRGMTEQDALAAATRGQHLVPGGAGTEGYYVGGPRNISSEADLLANRKRIDDLYEKNRQEITQAGGTPGDWYPSQRRGVAEIAEPYQQSRLARLRALTSADASPESETAFTMQGWNRAARGEPIGNIKYGQQGRELAAATAEGRPIKLGLKQEPYGQAADPTRPQTGLSGVNDFRQAQVLGYTTPKGKPWEAGLSPQQHTFADAESMLATQRAQARALAGRVGEAPKAYGETAGDLFRAPSEPTGQMIQEVTWIGNKADALQNTNPKRYPSTQAGRDAALQEAMKSGEQFQMKHAVGATYEQIPGRKLGHVPEIADAPTADKIKYGEAAPWTDEAGRDEMYKSLGLLQRPTSQGFGLWEGGTNPNYIAQPMADMKPGAILPRGMHRQLALAEHMRGLADVQDAAAYHIPMTQSTRSGKTHLLMPHEGALGEAQMQDLAGKLPPGWSPTPTPRGTMLMNFGEGNPAKESAQIAQTLGQPVERAGMESNLIDVYGGVPPGGGRATTAFLRRAAKSPQAEVQALGESEGIRRAIAGKHARDAMLSESGSQISDPAQATRRFLQETDWPKAVAMIKKGAKPEEAVAALGPQYKLSEMGYTTPQMAAILGGLAGGGYLLSRALRKKTPEQPAAPLGAGRSTADAFQQRQEAMDAVNEEIKRQTGRGDVRAGLQRMEEQLEREGK